MDLFSRTRLLNDHNYGEEAPRDWSVFAPDLEIVRGYIGFGARFDVEYPSGGGFHHEGITALHFAAVEGHLELTKLLVSAGADVNIKVSARADAVSMRVRWP